jgi:hypothetical protein
MQLRNARQRNAHVPHRSLPHRQLRKYRTCSVDQAYRSLPHRQLRKLSVTGPAMTPEGEVLRRCHLGLLAESSGVNEQEAVWVVRRLAELEGWDCPEMGDPA